MNAPVTQAIAQTEAAIDAVDAVLKAVGLTPQDYCHAKGLDEAAAEPLVLKQQQVAEMLQVSRMTVHRWKKSGILVPITMGNVERYPLEQVEKLAKRKG